MSGEVEIRTLIPNYENKDLESRASLGIVTFTDR